ncbi:hypothetical protein ACFOY2_28795 [Nonomuraea purpurea]|uniref:Transmembrane protein n=1 Tax=Nonomuraea purpurea TaxID=1849276 RepID=A0ABV8GB88_9ACTN
MKLVTAWWRRYRLDRNPLRRRSDRVESVALAVAASLVLLSLWPAVAAGRQAYGSVPDTTGRQQVRATLLADAPVAYLSFGEVATGELTPARWTTASGRQHTGRLRAPVLAKAGTELNIWVDAGGHQAAPPPSRDELRITGVATGLLIMLVSATLVTAAFAGVRWLLDRGRYRAWDAAWSPVKDSL